MAAAPEQTDENRGRSPLPPTPVSLLWNDEKRWWCGREHELEILRRGIHRIALPDCDGAENKNEDGENGHRQQEQRSNSTDGSPLDVTGARGGQHLPNSKRHFLVVGDAGMGKTSLIDRFVAEVEGQRQQQQQQQCWVARGKFESRVAVAASIPFEAVVEAVGCLVDRIVATSSSSAEDLAARDQRIRGVIEASELKVLCDVIPTLKRALANSSESKKPSDPSVGPIHDEGSKLYTDASKTFNFDGFGKINAKEWRFERFRFALRGLFRCICASGRPLVLVLDDFHWADPDSSKVVQTILEDSSRAVSSKLMVVLTSRLTNNGEIGFEHDRQGFTNENQPPFQNKMRTVRLPPLSSDEIGCLLFDFLAYGVGSERKKVSDLADVVRDKTGGNAFAVKHFLRLIENVNLLSYSSQADGDSIGGCWFWDAERITSEVPAISHDNVTEVVARNLMATLDDRLRSALTVAASFGVADFQVKTVVHAMTPVLCKNSEENSEEEGFSSSSGDPVVVRRGIDEMERLLIELVSRDRGYVERLSSGHFKFSHSRIREAAYSLLPANGCASRAELHLMTGRSLRLWIDNQEELGLSASSFVDEDEEEDHSLLLHATQQLNAGSSIIEDVWEKLDVADLNYRAAELAAGKASFFTAMEYLQRGLSYLGDRVDGSCWRDHYELTLKLAVALTRMQYCCGLLEECMGTAESVLRHARSYHDKRPVYFTAVFCLQQLGRLDEAKDLCLSVLEILGEPFPRRYLMFHVVGDVLRTRRILKHLQKKASLDFPMMSDRRLLDCIDFIDHLGEVSYLGGFKAYSALHPLRIVQLTVQAGNAPMSGGSFGIYGIMEVMRTCDPNAGDQFGRLALKLAEPYRRSHPGQATRATFLNWWCLSHWKTPIRDSLVPVSDAIADLNESGMLDYIHMDKCVSLRLMFLCGERLASLADECKKYSESLLDYNQMSNLNLNSPLFQTVLNLQVETGDPTVLTGELMNETKFQADCVRTRNMGAQYQFCFLKMILGFHFHYLKVAVRAIERIGRGTHTDGPLVTWRIFYSGLVYLLCFKETQKGSKYLRKAAPFLRVMRKWVKKGASNCVYMCSLLDAERLSCTSSNVALVKAAFLKAIQDAAQTKLLHHHALANELTGAYLSKTAGISAAVPYITRAVHLYQEWGSTAKVKDVKSRYSDVWLMHLRDLEN